MWPVVAVRTRTAALCLGTVPPAATAAVTTDRAPRCPGHDHPHRQCTLWQQRLPGPLVFRHLQTTQLGRRASIFVPTSVAQGQVVSIFSPPRPRHFGIPDRRTFWVRGQSVGQSGQALCHGRIGTRAARRGRPSEAMFDAAVGGAGCDMGIFRLTHCGIARSERCAIGLLLLKYRAVFAQDAFG